MPCKRLTSALTACCSKRCATWGVSCRSVAVACGGMLARCCCTMSCCAFSCCRRCRPVKPYHPIVSPAIQRPLQPARRARASSKGGDDGDSGSDSDDDDDPTRSPYRLMDPEARRIVQLYPGINTPLVSLLVFVTSSAFVYNLAYLLMAVVGLWYPLLYVFHLFDVMYVSVRLRGVVRAVEQTWGQLLLTGALTLFVVHAYAAVAFVYFREYYITENHEFACDTLASCYYYSLHAGLLQGGGVGAYLTPPALVTPNLHYVKSLLLDVSFFAVVNTVLVNGVVFSVILNKYTELREKLALVSADRHNTCFVCDVTRQKLERARGLASFDDHIHREHYVSGTLKSQGKSGVECVVCALFTVIFWIEGMSSGMSGVWICEVCALLTVVCCLRYAVSCTTVGVCCFLRGVSWSRSRV